jgi:hypothetical protein
VTSPYPLIATRSPTTKTVPLNQLPTGPGGLATYDEFSTDRETILADAAAVAVDTVNAYEMTFANAAPGSKLYAYQRDGVQSLRSVFTVRTDIFLIWVMPTEPTQGGGYAIPGDDWEPILASDAECDAQGLV